MLTIEETLKEALMEALSRFLAEKRAARQEQAKNHVIEWNKDTKAKFIEWLRLESKDEQYIRMRSLSRPLHEADLKPR